MNNNNNIERIVCKTQLISNTRRDDSSHFEGNKRCITQNDFEDTTYN